MHEGANLTTSSRNLVVVNAADDVGRWLSDLTRNHTDSITWTNSGALALRLVPSHCDARWLLGRNLADMRGNQLLDLLHTIEPDLDARLVEDWPAFSKVTGRTTAATFGHDGRIDER